MSGKVLMTAGAVLRGDDAVGPYLARLLMEEPVEGWEVIDGQQTPEDDIPVVRDLAPDFLLLVDAAAMDAEPGTIRVLEKKDVVSDYLMTTHTLPMTYLLDQLSDYCGSVLFLGIQAGHTDLVAPLTNEVREAAEKIYGWIKDGEDIPELLSKSGNEIAPATA